MIYNADDLKDWPVAAMIDGKYVAARPISGGFIFSRIKAAWLVLIGKADALIWTGQP
jgi:hypothetical protein